MSNSPTVLKIYFSSSFINLFVDEEQQDDLMKELMSNKSSWVTVHQKSGNDIYIKASDVVAIEKMEKMALGDDVVAVATLAQFAGVHEITIKRKFAHTLKTIGKIKRATKETVKQLRAYLIEKNEGNKSKVPSEKEFMNLFAS
ncbi:MAG: hypothetical protein HQK52_09355 [Oligoflexia bacterium]|nr:hypothetical protein [Oligoflexia bacterium]